MKVPLSTLFLFCFCISVSAQDNWHRYHQDNSGLLSNRVSGIAKGSGQSLWVAYAGAGGEGIGVSHFEDYTWTHYDHTNSGLLNSDIRAIKTDDSGNTWFACYNAGLVKFDGNTWTAYTTGNSGIVGNNVSTLHIDAENNIWIGAYSEGVSRFNGVDWVNYTADNAPFPDFNCVNDLTTDSEGNLWVGLGCGGGLAVSNKQTNTWASYSTANSSLQYYSVSAVIQDPVGKIWIGYPTNQNVISCFDNGTWVNYQPAESDFSGVAYDGFAIDGGGNLLCGTMTSGLLKFNGTAWDNMVSDTTTSSFSQSVVVDSEGYVWYAAFQEGLWTNGSLAEGAQDLVATTVNAAGIHLTWSPPPLAPVEGYVLERRQPEASGFDTVDILSANDHEYFDTGLAEGVSYQYRVLAYSHSVPLQYSDTSTATTNIKPIGGSFALEVLNNDTIRFSAEDFTSRFSDGDPNDVLLNVEINALPETGKLLLDDVPLNAPATIHIDEIGLLAFVPGAAATGETSFSYSVNDGKDNSALAYEVVISIFTITSVAEEMGSEFEMYPNPLIDNLVVESSIYRCFDTTIHDLAGHEVSRQETCNGKVVIRSGGLNSGMYILRISTSTGYRCVRKVIK